MTKKTSKYILSYGGGVNSSALFFYLLEKKLPLDIVVFSDTGEESEDTMQSVRSMQKICKIKNIPFVTVQSHHGNLYDYYYSKKTVMSMMKRDCTGKFKVAPIRKYLRDTFGKDTNFVMYIGIAWDEALRVRDSNVKYITNSYPFVEDKITRKGNDDILKKYNFFAIKSGCKGCMYNKRKNWIKMLIEDPKEFKRHMILEENNMRYPSILLNGQYSLRSLYESYKNQTTLTGFNDLEPSCDVSGSCFL